VFAREADEVFDENRGSRPFEGVETQALLWFMEQRPAMADITVDDRVCGPVGQFLGPDFLWSNSAGHRYVGDTAMHGDQAQSNIPRHVKVVMYTEPLTRETGCLRFIPGSHKPEYQERLKPLMSQCDHPDSAPFGVPGRDVPTYPVETQPGDIVMFSEHVWHGAFGGGSGRRQIGWVYGANPATEEELAALRRFHTGVIAMFHPHESFLKSEDPRVRRMVQPLVELGLA